MLLMKMVTGSWVGNVGNGKTILMMFVLFLAVLMLWKNSHEMTVRFEPDMSRPVFVSLLSSVSVLIWESFSEFLYFRFYS